MTWETANEVLYDQNPTNEQIKALETFVQQNSNKLKSCFLPENRDERPLLTKFIARLFWLLETPEAGISSKLRTAVENIAGHITRKEFFTGVFHQALQEMDMDLLELVYASLFTEIVFTSELTCAWFEELKKVERNLKDLSSPAVGLVILTSAQMLDMNQEWSLVKPKNEQLQSLDTIMKSFDNQTIRLLWWLTLFSMADQHYTTEVEDGVEIEPLMHALQVKNGVHWPEVLKSEISAVLDGAPALSKCLELLSYSYSFQIIAIHSLAQTVADVLKYVLLVSKPTQFLTSALASCVKIFPALQQEEWLPDEYLALTKTKCPFELGSLLSVAEILDVPSRIHYLQHMHTYTCVIPTGSLDFMGETPQSCVGQLVKVSKKELLLPHKASNNTSALVTEPGVTSGTLLAVEDENCLMMLRFKYSAWMLIGRILENANLEQQNNWDPLTIEILTLVTMTMHPHVLTEVSSVLASGDIVDLVAQRLQLWIHSKNSQLAVLALEFFTQFTAIEPHRVWIILNQLEWFETSNEVLLAAQKLIMHLWPSYNGNNELHNSVISKLVKLFCWHCLSIDGFDESLLPVFELLLPVSKELRKELLTLSHAHEISLTPLMENLDKRQVIEFCSFCMKYVTKSRNMQIRPQTCLEKTLFFKSKDLANLFFNNINLRVPILDLWSVLFLNTESPPLLAFIDEQQSKKLVKTLEEMVSDGLNSARTLEIISLFVYSARRQEGLLDLLRSPLIEKLEIKAPKVEDIGCLNAVLNTLRLVKKSLKRETIDFLISKVSEVSQPETNSEAGSEESHYAAAQLKETCIYLLTAQLSHDATLLHPITDKISDLTAKITAMHDIPSPDFSSLELKLATNQQLPQISDLVKVNLDIDHQLQVISAWCDFLKVASTKLTSATVEQKIEWAIELLKANSNALPISAQTAEICRTDTASFIFQQNMSKPSKSALEIILHQLRDITVKPNFSLMSSNSWLYSLLKILALKLAFFKVGDVDQESIITILDFVVIKQVSQLENSENTLTLHLSILKDSIRLLDPNTNLAPLSRAMNESGCDNTLLRLYSSANDANPHLGQLAIKHIQEWLLLPNGVMTNNFINNGLLNAIIESPLSIKVQSGGILAHENATIHGLWSLGILPIIIQLLVQLQNRFVQEGWLLVSTYKAQIFTCGDQWRSGRINLSLIKETTLIYALMNILEGLGSDPNNSSDFTLDKEDLKKNVDLLLSHQKYLSSRISASEDNAAVLRALADLKKVICS